MYLSTLTTITSIPAFVVAPQAPPTPLLLSTPRPLLQLAPPASITLLTGPAPWPMLAEPADRFRLAAPAPFLALCAPLTPRERFARDLIDLLDRHAAPVRLFPDRFGTPTAILDAQTRRSLCMITMNGGDLTVIRFPNNGGERRYAFRLKDQVALHRLVVELTRRFVA